MIDLGTNTFNLLIADVQEGAFTVVLSTKEAVLLGMGGINDAKITQEAIDRAMKAFERFVQLCDAFEVERSQVVAIGTSALRDATNAAELLDKVRSEHRISIEIVSGIREAELIYKGVKWTDPFDEPAIIMDIGGGSTEFISADKEGIAIKVLDAMKNIPIRMICYGASEHNISLLIHGKDKNAALNALNERCFLYEDTMKDIFSAP